MNDDRRKQEVTLSETITGRLAVVCADFDAAWQTALKGGSKPSLDTYLSDISGPDRVTLQEELQRISEKYEQRLCPESQPGADATIEVGGATQVAPDSPVQSHTLDYDSKDVPARKQDVQTLDHEPSGVSQQNQPSQTMAFDAARMAGSLTSGSLKETTFSLAEGIECEIPTVPGYEIVGELGRGGMGVVYKARQLGLNRWVALKMVLAGSHAGQRQLNRFYIEAQAVGRLQHPNIVQIYDVGKLNALPYFSLEFVSGGSLAEKVHRQPQPPMEAAHQIETLARAMYYAHQNGIIHRDLKPANILLTPDGIPKITDFGLAKHLEEESSQTKTGTLMGTPSYMAPEQAKGDIDNVGPSADIYSLGAMLYELLTGRPPFLGATAMETLVQVTNHEAPPPTRLQAHIPRDLETICLKCLQKDPRRRYLSAHELAEDLRRFLSGEPILARPVSAPERLWRWCVRNPRVAALLGAVAFLLVLVASGSLWAAIRISGEKKQTELQKEIAEQNAAAERVARQEADQNAAIAKQNAAETSRQAQVALGTVYDVVTTAEAKLSVRADMGPLRKELLELAMKRLDQISKDAATSGLADRTMGVALQRMGNFYGQLGKTEQQLEVYQRSLDIFNRLIVEQPKEDWNKFNAAGSYEELGEIGREIEPDPGKLFNYYNKALDLRKDLVAQIHGSNPTPFLRKRALVYTYIKLASLELTVGQPGRAHDHARDALRWSENATADDPTKANDRWELLSFSYLLLGKASHRLGAEEEGRQSCLRAVDLRQEWVNGDRDNARARQELGRAHNALGELEVESGRGQSALEHHQRARSVFEELLAKDKNNPELHWYLANTDYYVGNVHQSLGNKAKAEEHYRKCLKTREVLLKEDPNNIERKIELMLVQASLGQHKPASQAAAEVCKYAPKHPGKLFSAACGYARCLAAVTGAPSAAEQNLARQYGDKAVEVLGQAVAQGYKDAVAIGKSPELKSLQNLPGYQQIVTKLSNGVSVSR